MTAEKSTTDTPLETPLAAAATTSSTEKKGAAATEYQEKMRAWFIDLSPEDRAAALGFVDGPWTALWAQVVRASSLSSAQNQGGSPKTSSVASSSKKGDDGKCDVFWPAHRPLMILSFL